MKGGAFGWKQMNLKMKWRRRSRRGNCFIRDGMLNRYGRRRIKREEKGAFRWGT